MPTVIEAPKVRAAFFDLTGTQITVDIATADGRDRGGPYWFGRNRAWYGARRALTRAWVRAIVSRIELREGSNVVERDEEVTYVD